MGEPASRHEDRFTWTNYRTWPDDERWEIVGGEAFMMTAPSTRHQRIQADLMAAMIPLFRKGPCQVFGSPTDVKLSEEDVVQPDILVVCDAKQITATHIEGPPKLVVEILSPRSTGLDRIRKSRLYARSGVQEYWIVTPHPAVVEVFSLDGGSYRLVSYGKSDTLRSRAFPELSIPLAEVFTFPLEPGDEVPIVREPPGRYRSHDEAGAPASAKG